MLIIDPGSIVLAEGANHLQIVNNNILLSKSTEILLDQDYVIWYGLACTSDLAPTSRAQPLTQPLTQPVQPLPLLCRRTMVS